MKQPPTSDHANPPAELLRLRALIDGHDHEILETLAARDKVVKQVAELKKKMGLPIRDKARESSIISERRDHCDELELSAETVENVYRVLLTASRDRQAELGAEIPETLARHTVGIIGGKGGMGRLFAKLFEDAGQRVLVADLDTELTPRMVAERSDAVLVSVPIDRTTEVIRSIAPHCRKDGLIFDLTSTKTEPVAEMKRHAQCEVIGLHPMFGPNTHTLQEQRVVMIEGRVRKDSTWKQWLTTCLRSRGLDLLESTAEEHDKAMSIVQVLTHFSTEVTGLAMARLDVPVSKTLQFASPVYLVELLMTARHFGQNADLYGAIHRSNPNTSEITGQLQKSLSDWKKALESNDNAEFKSLFTEVSDFFGAFSAQALDDSAHLIDRVVERR